MNGTLTDVPGLLAGHYTEAENGTGCTVVLTPTGHHGWRRRARRGVSARR